MLARMKFTGREPAQVENFVRTLIDGCVPQAGA
jgi:hypothetical protein